MKPSEAKSEASQNHSSEEALITQRRAKAQATRERGASPYPNDVAGDTRNWVSDLRERYAGALEDAAEQRYDAEKFAAMGQPPTVTVLGRLMARRGFGKLAFLRLRDQGGELQLFARKNILGDDFSRLEEIDVGDHLEASGPLMLTKTGELSVDLKSLRLVSKALRPLPEKWHGLTDVEQRYRRRYVDFVANPGAAQTLLARSVIVQGLRNFLDAERFMEVETPTLHSLVGGATAKPFSTRHNALDLDLFLRIAPELYLKRLLVGGFERVYEIGRCYRNEGLSTRHNPEFTMLEFYQAYATFETLMDMGERLLRHVDGFLTKRFEQLGLRERLNAWHSARRYTLDEPFARVTMRQAVLSGLGKAQIDASFLESLTAPQTSAAAWQTATEPLKKNNERAGEIDWQNLGRALSKSANAGERLFVAYEYIAEPFLSNDYRSSNGEYSLPVFVTEHPTEVSPLARKKDNDPSVTERFELFVENREIGNAFSELNDPDDQAERFQAQVARKSEGQDETMDYDEDYIRALEHGMPPAAGFGFGVDRLVMMLASQQTIRDVIAFPLLRPEV